MTGGGRGSRGLVKNTAEGIREDKSFQQSAQCVCVCACACAFALVNVHVCISALSCKHACTDMSFLQMICLCVCALLCSWA